MRWTTIRVTTDDGRLAGIDWFVVDTGGAAEQIHWIFIYSQSICWSAAVVASTQTPKGKHFFPSFGLDNKTKEKTTKNHRRFVTGSPCPNAFSGPATNNSGTKMYTRCIRVSVRSIISAQQQQQQQQQQWNRCPGTATRRSDRGMRFTLISSTTKSIGWFSPKKFHSFHQQVDSLFN